MNRELTREEALSLHRQMWSDMQKELGDDPYPWDREKFKRDWCERHFPNQEIINNCFLCEYTGEYCDDCPIEWPNTGHKSYGFYCCSDHYNSADGRSYRDMLISRLLALPERNTDEQE